MGCPFWMLVCYLSAAVPYVSFSFVWYILSLRFTCLKLLDLISFTCTVPSESWIGGIEDHQRSLSFADAFDLALSGVAGCLGTHPGPEASYEVAFSMDSVRTINGPKKGRMRAAEGVCYLALAIIQHRNPFMDLSWSLHLDSSFHGCRHQICFRDCVSAWVTTWTLTTETACETS